MPDLRPQPLEALDDWVRSASELRDAARYRPSGEGIDAALVDLQVHIAISSGRERHHAAALP